MLVLQLAGRIALVTGAARGIGRAVAELFHAEGASVLLTDVEDAEGGSLAAALGERAEYHHLDVSREEDWQRAHHIVARTRGQLDVLVNNAAITGLLEPGHHDCASLSREVPLGDGRPGGCGAGRALPRLGRVGVRDWHGTARRRGMLAGAAAPPPTKSGPPDAPEE